MKKLKKTKAKLPKGEEVVGAGVPLRYLNKRRIKKLGTLKKRKA